MTGRIWKRAAQWRAMLEAQQTGEAQMAIA